jgi:hypothetical protein
VALLPSLPFSARMVASPVASLGEPGRAAVVLGDVVKVQEELPAGSPRATESFRRRFAYFLMEHHEVY